MEGPTPVSALIHAATMVTAGVYLIARFHPLFEIALTAADIAAFVGLATLLIAATIALVVTDLKRIIAYSTMSQIGYMIVGVGDRGLLGGPLPPDDPRLLQGPPLHGGRLGDRRDGEPPEHRPDGRLPEGAAVHLGDAASSAPWRWPRFPLTSGWFSKDEILDFAAYRGGFYVIFAIGGYIGALLTAFYAFRIGFRVVFGAAVRGGARSRARASTSTPTPENPATGELEDTDVGFPGEKHTIAERRPGR